MFVNLNKRVGIKKVKGVIENFFKDRKGTNLNVSVPKRTCRKCGKEVSLQGDINHLDHWDLICDHCGPISPGEMEENQ